MSLRIAPNVWVFCGYAAWVLSGGRPAAGKRYLSRQIPLHSKAEPGPVPLRGSLRCSQGAAAAELGLRPQTVLAEFPRLAALLGTCQGKACCIWHWQGNAVHLVCASVITLAPPAITVRVPTSSPETTNWPALASGRRRGPALQGAHIVRTQAVVSTHTPYSLESQIVAS